MKHQQPIRIENPTREQLDRCIAEHRPAIFSGVMQDSVAAQSWDLPYLRSKLAGRTVQVVQHDKPRLYWDPNAGLPHRPFTFDEFADSAFVRNDGGFQYLQDDVNSFPLIRDDYKLPPMMADKGIVRGKFWMSGNGLITPLHYDAVETLHWVIRGSKRFLCYGPGVRRYYPVLGHHHGTVHQPGRSRPPRSGAFSPFSPGRSGRLRGPRGRDPLLARVLVAPGLLASGAEHLAEFRLVGFIGQECPLSAPAGPRGPAPGDSVAQGARESEGGREAETGLALALLIPVRQARRKSDRRTHAPPPARRLRPRPAPSRRHAKSPTMRPGVIGHGGNCPSAGAGLRGGHADQPRIFRPALVSLPHQSAPRPVHGLGHWSCLSAVAGNPGARNAVACAFVPAYFSGLVHAGPPAGQHRGISDPQAALPGHLGHRYGPVCDHRDEWRRILGRRPAPQHCRRAAVDRYPLAGLLAP